MGKFLLKYYKVLVHGIIWFILFLLNISYFSSFRGIQVALERGVSILFVYLLIFYVNWFVLVPYLYIKNRRGWFLLAALLLLLLSASLRVGIELHFNIFDGLVRQQLVQHKPVRQFLLLFSFSLFIFIVSFLLRLAEYYTIQSRQKESLLQQKTEAELKLLKAQINPHFLFNALNNIYALVLTRSEKAAGSLMSLSQLLRYIIYDTEVEKVTLEKEITYLGYYIELESLRLTSIKNLRVNLNVDPNNYRIMPLTFIPFVENGFKHSDINKGGFIEILLTLNQNELKFICKNSYSKIAKNVDLTGGVGLANSKKRLEIVYPDQHNLNITDIKNVFCVELSIKL